MTAITTKPADQPSLFEQFKNSDAVQWMGRHKVELLVGTAVAIGIALAVIFTGGTALALGLGLGLGAPGGFAVGYGCAAGVHACLHSPLPTFEERPAQLKPSTPTKYQGLGSKKVHFAEEVQDLEAMYLQRKAEAARKETTATIARPIVQDLIDLAAKQAEAEHQDSPSPGDDSISECSESGYEPDTEGVAETEHTVPDDDLTCSERLAEASCTEKVAICIAGMAIYVIANVVIYYMYAS
jgi:hypothetical protein